MKGSNGMAVWASFFSFCQEGNMVIALFKAILPQRHKEH